MDSKVRVTGKKIDELQSGDRLPEGERAGISSPVRQFYVSRVVSTARSSSRTRSNLPIE